ncbi:hypothetical protein NIES2101_42315 [Calothrix sp. HK-06]|nr:hypothetical protein NIES2101_42315 [Calothrix sp. HK-06]
MDAYLAFFYTFVSILPWWRQRLVRIQIKLLHRPGWQRAIYDSWIAIVLMLILITQLVAYGLSTQTIAQFGLLFLVIVISIEGFWVRQQL